MARPVLTASWRRQKVSLFRLLVEESQVELAQARRITQSIDFDDPAPDDGETEDGERTSARSDDHARGAVDERRPDVRGEPREDERPGSKRDLDSRRMTVTAGVTTSAPCVVSPVFRPADQGVFASAEVATDSRRAMKRAPTIHAFARAARRTSAVAGRPGREWMAGKSVVSSMHRSRRWSRWRPGRSAAANTSRAISCRSRAIAAWASATIGIQRSMVGHRDHAEPQIPVAPHDVAVRSPRLRAVDRRRGCGHGRRQPSSTRARSARTSARACARSRPDINSSS
jgi:hypothetical protein